MSWGVTRSGATVFCAIGKQPGLKVMVPGAFGTFAAFEPAPKVNEPSELLPHTAVVPCIKKIFPVGTTEPVPTTVTR